jgi:hypothetical protein
MFFGDALEGLLRVLMLLGCRRPCACGAWSEGSAEDGAAGAAQGVKGKPMAVELARRDIIILRDVLELHALVAAPLFSAQGVSTTPSRSPLLVHETALWGVCVDL